MNEIITGVNKEVWIPAIKEAIAGWKDFSESVFCADPEDKRYALGRVAFLEHCLTALESDTLTKKQFDDLWMLAC